MAPPTVTALLLVAVVGASAFTPPQFFGPPRTRSRALAYAKKAVFKDAEKDIVATPVPVIKGARQGRVSMIIDPNSAVVAGSVAVPEWFLPVAAVGALTLPIVILFTFGDMDTDRFRRQQNGGVTLQGRAVNDFKRGLTKENFDRVLLRLGVKKAEPPPTAARDAAAAAGEAAATARSELGLRSNQAVVTYPAGVDEPGDKKSSVPVA